MSDLEVLKTVREEWSEDKYCANSFAQDKNGLSLNFVQSLDAAKWCVQGYIAKVMGFKCGSFLWGTNLYENVLEPIAYEQNYLPENNIASINNYCGHAAALKIINEAITQLEACEQEEEYVCEELVGV